MEMNKKFKVVHLSSVHPDYDTRIFHKECASLTEKYDTSLIIRASTSRLEKNVRIIALPAPVNRWQRIFKTTFQTYQLALAEDADIYHFHDPELLPIGLMLKLRGNKVIYDAHEDLPRQIREKDYLPAWVRGPLATLIRWFENFAARRMSAVVTATPYIRDKFLAAGARAVDVNNFPMLSELMLDEPDWESKESVVCYVGTIWDKRGLFQMLEACELSQTNLLMGGTFSDEGQKAVAESHPGWKHVEYLGHLDRSGVVDVLKRSTAGLVLLHPIR
ncbi:MAG: glycosyltransferase, partial [Pseudomonadales bacterium]|nr:glycosyltransferase [Pseudomonadales bacterium]